MLKYNKIIINKVCSNITIYSLKKIMNKYNLNF